MAAAWAAWRWRTHLFFSRESQYLASSSGDLLEDWAILVTALLLMKRPHACTQKERPRRQNRACRGGGSELRRGGHRPYRERPRIQRRC